VIASIVAFLKKINPIQLIKKGVQALKNKKSDKEAQIKLIMQDFEVSRAEAEKIYREEKQGLRKLERKHKKDQRQLDRAAKGGNLLQRLFDRAKTDPKVKALTDNPQKFIADRKQLLNQVVKGGKVETLADGTMLVTKANGETIVTDKNNVSIDQQGNIAIVQGATIPPDPGTQNAGLSTPLLIGGALVLGGLLLSGSSKKSPPARRTPQKKSPEVRQ
jgi:hypothetical protein